MCVNLQHDVEGARNEDARASSSTRAVEPTGAIMPPGLASLQGQSAGAMGTRHGVTQERENTATLSTDIRRFQEHHLSPRILAHRVREGEPPRSFDDVFTFFAGTGSGTSMVSGRDPEANPQVGTNSHPLRAYRGVGPTGGLDEASTHGHLRATSVPTDVLTTGELSMILKAIQTCVGEFPTMELGSVAERPEHLRRWRYAVRQALEAAGHQVMDWWSWCWEVAEETRMPST